MHRSEPRPGTVFGGYLIERVLGAGGMGTVFVARHPRLPRRDALKVLSAELSANTEFRRRFEREAEFAARLDHPNIVTVYDRGITEERLWIAMQFVDGTDAAALVRRHRSELPPHRVVHILSEAAHGLDAAHRAGLLHRDIKPANILVQPRPGFSDRVLVSDFGIAKAVDASTALTETGAVLATLPYAAPEQLTLTGIDHRADLYSLGCTVFELLTGSKPFPRDTAAAVMAAHLQDPPPRASSINPALRPAVDAVIARAMAKHPDYRHSSCGALAADLATALGLPPRSTAPLSDRLAPTIVATPHPDHRVSPGKATPTRRWRRPRAIAAFALLLAVVLVAGGVVWHARAGNSHNAAATTSPATTIRASRTWGNVTYIAQSFPKLLPADQDSTGYQGIRCVAVGDGDHRPIDVTAPVTGLNVLSCNGNKNPVELLAAACYSDHTAVDPTQLTEAASTSNHTETWTRPSGSGTLTWGDFTSSTGQSMGRLATIFTDATRKPCLLTVYGGTNGQDLHDNWWPTAPL
ncbi:serine/threonine-protein kinase [Nocardia sp. NPDC020380]|uniref:serine/threonine-protein kinase n=1 Tax=Nocardia sp. NPDC020380 TaxID=3364309 RepID=UPI0037AE0731